MATDDTLDRIDDYIAALFAPEDAVLRANRRDADAAGLPAINVSPAQGRLLMLLTMLVGARRVLEVGTLGGYSTTWLARALPAEGIVVTLERESRHADVARRSLARLAGGPAIDVRVGAANDSLRAMIAGGEPPFDVVFIDADKPGYLEYLELSLALSRPGTLLLADNVIRNGLVLDPQEDDANARGARDFNAALAANPRLEAIVVPIIRQYVDGLAIARVVA